MSATKIKSEDLSGCPFCGSDVMLWETGFGIPKVIECGSCHTLFLKRWGIDMEDLKKQWNTRNITGKGETDGKSDT